MVNHNSNIRLLNKSFDELSNFELYATLSLRSQVFISEQQCLVSDLDNKDQECHHVLMFDHDCLIASSRLVPAGRIYNEMAVGRVVVHPAYRKKGIGQALMRESIRIAHELYGRGPIRIGAQEDTIGFYESIGLFPAGEPYVHGGIRHIEMLNRFAVSGTGVNENA